MLPSSLKPRHRVPGAGCYIRGDRLWHGTDGIALRSTSDQTPMRTGCASTGDEHRDQVEAEASRWRSSPLLRGHRRHMADGQVDSGGKGRLTV